MRAGKKKIKYNIHEQAVMFPITVMKIITVLMCMIALVSPMYDLMEIGFTTMQAYFAVGIYIYTLLNGIGKFNQTVPLPVMLTFRVVQFCYFFFVSEVNLNYITFAITVVFEIAYFAYFMYDRGKFVYVKE